jgi:hypothetical protein
LKSNLFAALVLLLAVIGPIAAAAVEPSGGLPAPSERGASGMPDLRSTAEGFTFVDQDGPVIGDGDLRTYRLEVEPDAGVNPWVFSDLAERILSDERGWTGTGDWALQRVTADPDIRVVVATPGTVDRLCALAGLDTHGEVSCWNGEFAALNVDRWRTGADGFTGPLPTYRRYLLNHEVGHGLGYSHEVCPRRGAPAPVMQQQTYATRPCVANGWPVLRD